MGMSYKDSLATMEEFSSIFHSVPSLEALQAELERMGYSAVVKPYKDDGGSRGVGHSVVITTPNQIQLDKIDEYMRKRSGKQNRSLAPR
jgi:formate-dependent phosphoribosylglycinamide formyltransferase (GAR transformylase)